MEGLFSKKKKTDQRTTKGMYFLKKVAKIYRLPKNAKDSVPIRGIMENGIIETEPGTFTKTYPLSDVNFSIVPYEEQSSIFKAHMEFLNSFGENIRWQFCFYKHSEDKRKTASEIRLKPVNDGLKPYRNEMNHILAETLKSGNNSYKMEKMLTIAIDDTDADHVVSVFKHMDLNISEGLKRICHKDTVPYSTLDRIKMLYQIYNPGFDYRFATGIYNDEEVFDLRYVEKSGLSVKDIIGPQSIDYSNRSKDYFLINDTYVRVLYLEKIPSQIKTDLMADLCAIESDMLISVNGQKLAQEKAIKMVKNKKAALDQKAAKMQSRNAEDGYFGDLPLEMENTRKNTEDIMNDLVYRNQNMFFTTFTIAIFQNSLERLNELEKQVITVGGRYVCPIKRLKFQQEFAFNTTLPLCRNDLMIEKMYNTETTAVFIPYDAEDLKQKDSIFYGLNQKTGSMVLYDRTTGDNANAMVFGHSGSGKSFFTKMEMLQVLLTRQDAQVFVIDPQGEYAPLAKELNGAEINIKLGSKHYLNPLDLDISSDGEDEVDPVTMKSDYVKSLVQIMGNRQLTAPEWGILDKCVRQIYKPYIDELIRTGKTCDKSKCPQLTDLYTALNLQRKDFPEAGSVADMIKQYTVGSFDTFAHRTNIKDESRFIVYNIKNLGTNMKELGLFICLNQAFNQMIYNSSRGIHTFLYLDEFHLLLESPDTTVFVKRVWKMARKWLGVTMCMQQNTEDLLRNADTRNIVNNTSFVVMLSVPEMDRQNLQELFPLSDDQLEYITNKEKGHGLIFNGSVVVPFGFKFPKNTQIYKMLTTSHDVEGAMYA